MPYRAMGKCVWKLDKPGGKPVEKIKCHPTTAKAKAHATALNMNVDKDEKKKSVAPVVDETKHFVGNDNMKKIQKMHDASLDLGAKCGDKEKKDSELLTQEGGDDAQQMHDMCVNMGAKCKDASYTSMSKSLDGDALDAESVLDEAKCMVAEPLYYWGDGAMSFADLDAYREAQKDVEEVHGLASDYESLQHNILKNPEVKDKRAGLADLAEEFLARVSADMESDEYEEDEEAKSIIPNVIKSAESRDHLMTIKSIGDNRVGSYCVLWGDVENKDLTGEFFTPTTAELKSIFEGVGRLPMLYQHALDAVVKTRVFGVVDTLVMDDVGMWYEAELKKADEYDKMVEALLRSGKLKTSTQTFASARRVTPEGKIERWPIVEITATPTPAEFRMPVVSHVKSAFAEIGCEDFTAVIKSCGVDYETIEKSGLFDSFGKRLPDESAMIRLLATQERERIALLDL